MSRSSGGCSPTTWYSIRAAKQEFNLVRNSCAIYQADDDDEDDGPTAASRFEAVRERKRLKLAPQAAVDPPSLPSPPSHSLTPQCRSTTQCHGRSSTSSTFAAPDPNPRTCTYRRWPACSHQASHMEVTAVPEPPVPVPELEITEPDEDATPPPGPTAFVWESIKTAMNTFGLYREYLRVPTHDPDSTISLSDLSDAPKPPPPPAVQLRTSPAVTVPPQLWPSVLAAVPPQLQPSAENPYYPFPNSTAYGITNWMWTGSALKSIQELIQWADCARRMVGGVR
ncbi:hypothetical protein C8J57DRAFT_1220250 [Mycena rebaudengoi]|nr:hypothetical protein C8J57DRAFT_1220250 [Mycena rebaudengoi]